MENEFTARVSPLQGTDPKIVYPISGVGFDHSKHCEKRFSDKRVKAVMSRVLFGIDSILYHKEMENCRAIFLREFFFGFIFSATLK
ncbi:MAG: hypothetical protein ACJAXD_002342 [Cryomorphaceae bacterium]|jgi:hypothetical protein